MTNRPIKFRAWNFPTKRMFYWGTLQEINKIDARNIEEEHNHFMQFTGLYDKNGKEIYEGDVIGWTKGGEGFGDNPYFVKMEVRFKDGAFYTHTEFSVNENYLPIVAVWGEVIGNIYENPELLTKEV